MVIKNTNKKAYLKLTDRGYEYTSNVDKATDLDYNRAINYINNCISPNERDSFITIDRNEIINNYEIKDRINKVLPKAIDHVLDEKEAVRNFINIYNSAKEYLPSQEKKLKEIENAIIDILHYIEFNDFSASNGYKLAKILKNLRLERRKLKTRVEEYKLICNSINSEQLSNLNKYNDYLENKEYKNREINDPYKLYR